MCFWTCACSSAPWLAVAIVHGASLTPDLKTPWLQGISSSNQFEVVSIVTHLDGLSFMRTNLLTSFPLKVHMLGLERGYQANWSNVQKLFLLHEYVAGLPPDKIVFVLDFFDVVWLCCRHDLVDSFRRFNRPLVFSAEVMPYPLTNTSLQRIDGGYPELLGQHHMGRHFANQDRLNENRDKRSRYRFLNSGCAAGYAGAWWQSTKRMLANHFDNEYVLQTPLAITARERKEMLVGTDDQIAWHTYAHLHREEVALDYDAELFLSTLGYGLQDFELRDQEIWARPFGRPICFAHGNGATNIAKHIADARRLGVQPSKCQEHLVSNGGMRFFQLICQPPR